MKKQRFQNWSRTHKTSVLPWHSPRNEAEVIQIIRKQTDKPIRYVFDTHYHGDHADGNQHYTRLGATAVAYLPLLGGSGAEEEAGRRSAFETLGARMMFIVRPSMR